jgi:hypothetical protein
MDIWRFEKHIALSEKKPPLIGGVKEIEMIQGNDQEELTHTVCF